MSRQQDRFSDQRLIFLRGETNLKESLFLENHVAVYQRRKTEDIFEKIRVVLICLSPDCSQDLPQNSPDEIMLRQRHFPEQQLVKTDFM